MLLYTPMAAPPVSYDNSATTAYENTVASGSPIAWTHNPTCAGAYAIVALFAANVAAIFLPGTAVVTSATFGGLALSSLGFIGTDNSFANGWTWVFGVANVPGGSNAVSITLTESGKDFQGFGTSFTYTSVGSVGTLQTAAGTTDPMKVTVSSAAGNLVWGATCASSGLFQTALTFSSRQQEYSPATFPMFSAGDRPGVASTVMSANGSNSFQWGAAGLNLSQT